jgi:hypothetical protein
LKIENEKLKIENDADDNISKGEGNSVSLLSFKVKPFGF